jgi:hypothetical protein
LTSSGATSTSTRTRESGSSVTEVFTAPDPTRMPAPAVSGQLAEPVPSR